MPKKFYTSIPMNYAVCLHHDCPKAATCLHQIAYQTLVEQKNYLNLINPNRCGKDDSCLLVIILGRINAIQVK